MEMNDVRAFLRTCGVQFRDDELVGIPQDRQPPDIQFRGVSFEVTERVEDTRKRGDEYQSMIQKIDKANSILDLGEVPQSSIPMEFSQLLEEIEKGMVNKYSKYGNSTSCEMLDLLVYVNLKRRHLNPRSERCLSPEYLSKVKRQGWRSISFLTNNCAGVLFCKANASDFLKNLDGYVIWTQGRGVFED